jgi:hypothetical protein
MDSIATILWLALWAALVFGPILLLLAVGAWVWNCVMRGGNPFAEILSGIGRVVLAVVVLGVSVAILASMPAWRPPVDAVINTSGVWMWSSFTALPSWAQFTLAFVGSLTFFIARFEKTKR